MQHQFRTGYLYFGYVVPSRYLGWASTAGLLSTGWIACARVNESPEDNLLDDQAIVAIGSYPPQYYIVDQHVLYPSTEGTYCDAGTIIEDACQRLGDADSIDDTLELKHNHSAQYLGSIAKKHWLP